jgi:hypothetical protein
VLLVLTSWRSHRRCVCVLLSRDGSHHSWHSSINCEHGDSIEARCSPDLVVIAGVEPVAIQVIDAAVEQVLRGPAVGEVQRRSQLLTTCVLLSRGGCHNSWHSVVNCDHGDSITCR